MICLCAAFGAFGPALAQDGPQFRSGDDTSWAEAGVEPGAWQPMDVFESDPQGVFWIRQQIYISPGNGWLLDRVIIVEAHAAYQVFWDGRMIGQSGRVGETAQEESPGFARAVFGVPPAFMTDGSHTLAIRASSMNREPGQSYFLTVEFADAGTLIRSERRRNALAGAAAGLSLLLMVLFAYIAAIRPVQRGRFLLAAGISAAALAIVVLELATQAFAFSYPLTHWLERLAVLPAVLLYLGMPLFVALRFELQRVLLWPGLAGVGLLASLLAGQVAATDADMIAFAVLCLLGMVMGLTLFRAARRNAMVIFGAFAICLVAIFLDRQNLSLFLVAIALLFSAELVFDLVYQEIRMARLSAKASRLQVEVLSRHIQPHFIMNSLTTVMELYETRQDEAVGFIEDLAAEFRQFARMADHTLVTLDQELELCRAHAGLMSRRMGKDLRLLTDVTDMRAMLPPGVIHTLLDNALTHNSYDAPEVVFRLAQKTDATGTVYVFTAPLGARTRHTAVSSGTGTRYMNSRLNEAFGHQWSMVAGPEEDNWVTRIHIGIRS
ncbi:MAG: hypothetical protein DHS20C06_16010 [Hyphobacterium sp.]|nr:MAG: hypothetical protein DHS20C06_16010 [Hyphobacterium sp.]